jgi:hypothetical protein
MRSAAEEAPNRGNGLEADTLVDAKAVRRRGDRDRRADATPQVTPLGRDVLNLCGSRSVEYACRRD